MIRSSSHLKVRIASFPVRPMKWTVAAPWVSSMAVTVPTLLRSCGLTCTPTAMCRATWSSRCRWSRSWVRVVPWALVAICSAQAALR